MKTIKIKEFEVPVNVMSEVAQIITDNELENSITGVDEEGKIIFVEVRYEKGIEDEQAAVHEIQDVIEDYEEDEDDKEENDDEQED